jgi:CheY-like chemotaxis protein
LLAENSKDRAANKEGIHSMGSVLVIDDEKDMLLLCRLNLGHAGMEVREAGSGAGGLASALEDTPDAVVLDLMMPEMDGYEVLRRLREDQRTCDVPVVIVTAKTGEADRRRCDELGADAFLTKPFVPDDLTQKLDALIERRVAS